MKSLKAICVGALVGFFVGLVVFVGPLAEHSLPARIWFLEEKPIGWVVPILTGSLGMAMNRAMILVMLAHFAFWVLLGCFIFVAAVKIRSRFSSND